MRLDGHRIGRHLGRWWLEINNTGTTTAGEADMTDTTNTTNTVATGAAMPDHRNHVGCHFKVDADGTIWQRVPADHIAAACTALHGPTPYQPEPGAVICLAGDVPDGWECRGTADEYGWSDLPQQFMSKCIVEARPIPAPPLMVAIPRDVAARYSTGRWVSGDADAVQVAIRAALDAEAVES